MGRVGFGDDKTAGGILVKAVHNAGSLDAADAGEFAFAMMEQGVDESAIGISRSGMNDHAVRFVKNDEVFVLE